jgi:cation-transporting ATPase 13A3/4/5
MMLRFLFFCCAVSLADGRALFGRQKANRSAFLIVDQPAGELTEKGLRGGVPFDKDLRKQYEKSEKELREQIERSQKDLREQYEKLQMQGHWDLPLVPQKDMSWWMFARVVEKDVLLAVHEGYMFAWCAAVTILLILTAAFVGYSHSLVGKDSSEMCQPFQEIPTGEDIKDTLVQKGFAYSSIGASIYWLWVFLPLLGYIQMALIALDHYFFALHEPDLTWNQWAQPYLMVFCLSHLTLFLQTQYLARARVFFMLPEPLATATVILIQDTAESKGDGSLVHVEFSDSTRYFEHTCIRYIWSDKDHLFAPVGTEVGLTGVSAAKRVLDGGLTQEQVRERQIMGSNEIHVPVPGIIASLAEEFLTPLYVFQFAAMWLYLFIDGWNIAAIWVVWTLAAGISKSLCVVRRNRLKVQAMARTEARATVLREGKWTELSSVEVVPGDVIMIEEGMVTCDVVVVKGGAVANESMLTGEPMPVQRFAVEDVDSAAVSAASHKKHLLFTGTIVMQSSGDAKDSDQRGTGVVFNTGPMTMKGSLVRTVLFPEPISFKFTDQLPRVYGLMFIYVCCLFTIMQLFANTGSWIFGLYIGFTILVQSLNPLLPVSITFAHTVGSEKLNEVEGVHCLSPQRLPIAGKVQVMVMDKTGTITKEGMEFRGAHISEGDTFGKSPVWAEDGQLDTTKLPEAVSWALAACHTVTRLRDGNLVGNMVEVAMLNSSGWTLSEDSKSVLHSSGDEIQILKQLEFDQKRMTSGAVIQVKGKTLALIKGSYERVAELTKTGIPKNFQEVTEGYAADQYYVLGVGMKTLADKGELAPREQLEQDLSFVGLLLFRNEMKSDSPDAVKALKEGGTRSVICTGDNALTGAAIGRQCGLIDDNQEIILGDLQKNGSFSWTRLHDKKDVSHKEIIEAKVCEGEIGNAELVVTKIAFRELEKNGELEQLLGRIRVYARMKPDDKVAVVQNFQHQGLVVGMVGDGGNDCGAMRAAHVGLALSDAEASIVAPFSSGATYGTGEKSLMAVPHLFRYGRATLQTNSGTFLFFMIYGFALPTSKLTQTLMSSAMMAEWDWLFIDVILAVMFVSLMTKCRPAEKLAPIRPTSALLEGRTISSVALHMFFFLTFYALSLNILWAQPFHVQYDTKNINIPAHEWPKKGDNFDCAVTFLVLATQLLTAGYAGCLGAEHRSSLFKDIPLTLCYIAILMVLVFMVIGGPTDFHCIFRTNCDNKTSRQMYVPLLQHFSAGNVGGCFLGPQLEGWKEELGDRWQFPDEASNKCFPAEGFDPEKKISVPSEALFGLGNAMCEGPHNCFSEQFRIIFAILLVAQSGLSILSHKLLLMWHPATKEHFKRL